MSFETARTLALALSLVFVGVVGVVLGLVFARYLDPRDGG